MSHLSNYPPGAMCDDNAPWNCEEEEQFRCTNCDREMDEEGELCMSCWLEADDDNQV